MADDFNVLDQAGGASEDPQAGRFGLKLITLPAGAVYDQYNLSSGLAAYVITRASASATLTHLGIYVGTAGATDGGANEMGIFSVAGERLGVTGEMDFTAAGWIEGALTAPVAIVAGTSYYLGCVTHYGTPPKIAAGNSTSFDHLAINGVRPTIYHTGQAAMPASFTPGSLTVNATEYLMGAR